MDGYELDKVPFCTSPDDFVLAFRDRNNHSIAVIRHDLTDVTYRAQLSEIIDEVFNMGLEQARTEGQCDLKILEIQVDLKNVPENYSIFHVLDTRNVGQMEDRKEDQRYLEDEEVKEYLKKNTMKLEEVAQKKLECQELYDTVDDFFYENDDKTVRLYKGRFSPIIVKRHEFFKKASLHRDIAKAINAGLVQARVLHPHTCRIIAMHLDISKAPKCYYLDHILEALEKDVEKEIKDRQSQSRQFSELELWEFLRQTASALSFAHEKVLNM